MIDISNMKLGIQHVGCFIMGAIAAYLLNIALTIGIIIVAFIIGAICLFADSVFETLVEWINCIKS